MKRRKDKQHQAAQGRSSEQTLRARIAAECARIIVREGVVSYHSAKIKAAQRLGCIEAQALPSNEAIEAAVIAYQRLFSGEEQPQQLKKLRQTALEGMTFFEHFQPRLVGTVLSGSAGQHAEIHLHLFADCGEEVNLYLLDKHIDHDVVQRRYFINGETALTVSAYRFMVDGTTIEASVFPQVTLRQTVHATAKGAAIERAPRHSVEKLLQADPNAA